MYDVLLCDPPWSYRKGSVSPSRDVSNKYDTMNQYDLCSLQVSRIANEDSLLFLWATCPMLPEAMEVMSAWGFCCQVGTKVLTDDLRWVNAEALQVGDRVISFDENLKNVNPRSSPRRYFQWGTVLSTGVEPLPCYEIMLSNGVTLTSTGIHKWLGHIGKSSQDRVNRWITTEDIMSLVDSGRTPSLMKIAPVEVEDTDYDAGFLSAAFDGEGSLVRNKWNFQFAQNENDFLVAVENKLKSKGFDFARYSYLAKSKLNHVLLKGGRSEALRFMMRFRPPRLLRNWLNLDISKTSLYNMEYTDVVSVKFVGLRDVVTLMTDKGTYVANGYGSHNTYKTVAFNWIKRNKIKESFFWGGGSWTRANSELCLLGVRGKPKRASASVHQVIYEPVSIHSRKPSEARHRIEELCGPSLKVELFATEKVKGWDHAGYSVGVGVENFIAEKAGVKQEGGYSQLALPEIVEIGVI